MFTGKHSTPTLSIILLTAFVSLAILQPPALFAQTPLGTEFTYQGQLKDGGIPADGSHDLRFTMFDALVGGNQWRDVVCLDNVNVVDGLFTVQLDFGASIFDDGDAWWLEVEVRADNTRDNCASGRYTTLAPRQPLTATPYALYALDGPGVGLWATSGDSIYNTNTGGVSIRRAQEGANLVITGPSRTGLDGHLRITELPGLNRRWRMVLDGNEINTWDTNYPDPISLSLNSDSAGDVLLADGGGNVGIGTTTPAARLEVVDLAQTAILASSRSSIGVRGIHTGTGPEAGVYGETKSASSSAVGVIGFVNRSFPGEASTGVRGINGGGFDNGIGVWGSQKGSGWGVYGDTPSGRGVYGRSDDGIGVYGFSANAIADWFRGAENNGSTAALGVKSGGQVMLLDGNEIDATGGKLFLNNNSRFAVVVPIIEITGADLAEKFPVSEEVKPGMVVAIDRVHPGQLCLSRGAYNRRVAGVVSGANGLSVGAVLGNLPGNEDAPPIALSGRVWVYCDASDRPIEPGDLLTTAETPGHAMKVTDYPRAQGAIIGKAMTILDKGETGMVLVLINLQ